MARRLAQTWRDAVESVILDLAGSYRAVTMLPHTTQVADHFHAVRAANEQLDEVRRRVQNETLRHPGRRVDLMYRARRLLVTTDQRLDSRAREWRRGLLAVGDPKGPVHQRHMMLHGARLR
jgi:transposase